jgi:hypothetical protein
MMEFVRFYRYQRSLKGVVDVKPWNNSGSFVEQEKEEGDPND